MMMTPIIASPMESSMEPRKTFGPQQVYMSAREEIIHVVKSDRAVYDKMPENKKHRVKAYQTQRVRFGGGFGTTNRFP